MSTFASGRRRRVTTFHPTKCARSYSKEMRWTTLLNRFCWARLLISSRRMLASNECKKQLLKKKIHERIGRKSVAGADSDGRGADWPRRAKLRCLLCANQGWERIQR